MLSLSFALSFSHSLSLSLCSYLKYNGKPVSVMDALDLTLHFVREQGSSHQPEEGNLEEGNLEEGERGTGKRARITLRPSPQSVSATEMSVLENCLSRWSQELNIEVKGTFY